MATLWDTVTDNSTLPVEEGTTFWDHITNQNTGTGDATDCAGRAVLPISALSMTITETEEGYDLIQRYADIVLLETISSQSLDLTKYNPIELIDNVIEQEIDTSTSEYDITEINDILLIDKDVTKIVIKDPM